MLALQAWTKNMEIKINGVYEAFSIDGLTDGIYRVLNIYSNEGFIIVFNMSSMSKITKPISIDLNIIEHAISDKEFIEIIYETPEYQLIEESDIKKEYRNIRDKKFEIIKNLIDDDNFLLLFSSQKKSKLIYEQAKIQNIPANTIYRVLSLFWKYGQNINSLLPAYMNSGASGKSRIARDKKIGAPKTSTYGLIEKSSGINISEKDKIKIKAGLKKHYFNSNDNSLRKAYKKTLNDQYKKEIIAATSAPLEAKIPSYNQFKYWRNKLFSEQEQIVKSTSDNNYQKNQRGILSISTLRTPLIGSAFEIDSTVADVYIVSSINRNYILGRPTIYFIIDRVSRMITGIHVSMEYASWSAARQALVNTFISKKDYCKKFGIDILDTDWPCNHIPKQLVCDRGEMICNSPESLVVPLMQLNIAPPYRPDFKGIVERRFGIINEQLIHELKGTTRGKTYIRGERDPKKDSIYTLNEFTQLLIVEILRHNNISTFNDLMVNDNLLMENNLLATPKNYWEIHYKKHQHALKTANEIDIRASLLPKDKVSMTSRGIMLNEDLYYSCAQVENEKWASNARTNQRWTMEARIDQDDSSFIYVRLQPHENFTKCGLLPRSKNLANLPLADIILYKELKRIKSKESLISVDSIRFDEIEANITKFANIKTKDAIKEMNGESRTSNMKSRRKEEIESDKKHNLLKTENIEHPSQLIEPKDNEITKNSNIDILRRKR